MIKVWDYFMRRKSLLLLMLVLFSAGGVLSYRALQSCAVDRPVEYIRIDSLPVVEIPRTGGEASDPEPSQTFSVMNPNDVTSLTFSGAESINSQDSLSDEDRLLEQQIKLLQEQNQKSQSAPQAQRITVYMAEPTLAPHSFLSNLLLGVVVLVVIALGTYLTYQHFMR